MTQKKKKKATTRELLLGGGILALFFPLILFALFGAGVALPMLLVILIADVDTSSLGPIVLIHGILFVVMLFILVKFSARFRMLMGRLIGIFQERRRYHNAVADSPAAIDLDDADSLHAYAADPQAAHEHTEHH